MDIARALGERAGPPAMALSAARSASSTCRAPRPGSHNRSKPHLLKAAGLVEQRKAGAGFTTAAAPRRCPAAVRNKYSYLQHCAGSAGGQADAARLAKIVTTLTTPATALPAVVRKLQLQVSSFMFVEGSTLVAPPSVAAQRRWRQELN